MAIQLLIFDDNTLHCFYDSVSEVNNKLKSHFALLIVFQATLVFYAMLSNDLSDAFSV